MQIHIHEKYESRGFVYQSKNDRLMDSFSVADKVFYQFNSASP